MTPEYLEELAELADPGQLWRLRGLEQLDLPADKRRQLDTAVALRRHASHIKRLDALRKEGRSLLLTPLSLGGTAIMEIDTPPEHARLRRDAARVAGAPGTGICAPNYAEAARKLWMLLDDIDTLDDACRADDAAFRKHTRDVQRKRFAILNGEQMDVLAPGVAAAQPRQCRHLSECTDQSACLGPEPGCRRARGVPASHTMPPEVAKQYSFFRQVATDHAYYADRLDKLAAWLEQRFTAGVKGLDDVR